MNVDFDGHIAHIIVQVILGMVSSALVYVASLIGRYWSRWKKHWSWRDFGFSVLTGAIIGLLGPYAGLMKHLLYPIAAKIAIIAGWGIAGGICTYLAHRIYIRRR